MDLTWADFTRRVRSRGADTKLVRERGAYFSRLFVRPSREGIGRQNP